MRLIIKNRFIALFFILICLLFITVQLKAQCTSGCTSTFNTCANIAGIAAVNGTAGVNNVVCISPPAGCGNITVGNVQLGQYQRLVICTNSPTDTVKFIGNFASSGGGGAAANDNTRFVDVYGNAQITYAGTVVWGSRIVINIASTGTLDLKNPVSISFLNSSSMTNAGKIVSRSDLIFTSSFTGPMINTGTINATNIAFNGGGLTNSGTVQASSGLTFATGTGVVMNTGNFLAGCDLNITSGVFTNSNYVYSQCNTIVSTAITNNAKFKTEGTLTLNASGTFNFQNGTFESDTLILNGGNINAGTGCAAFIVHKFSSIQNGSGFTSVPANSVGIYDTGNPGSIDNVSVGCGGANPAVLYNAGPYCGVIPLSGVSGMGTSSGCFASLPVKWLSVSANQEVDASIAIAWTTANEMNNDYFTVLRSTDGISFKPVSNKMKGIGNSSIARSYTHFDHFSYEGIVYYKIMQTDYDGKSTYSDLVEVDLTSSLNALYVNVFPNPSLPNENINLTIAGIESNEEILVVLIDRMGNTLYAKTLLAEYNEFVFALGNIDLPKGVYFISASTDQSVVTKKLVVN